MERKCPGTGLKEQGIIPPCRDLDESLSVLRRDGFLYLHVSSLLPSIAEARKSEWWVQMIEEHLAVNTKLVAGKTTLVSPEVFRLWTTAYGGSAAARNEADMRAGLMGRDAYHLLNMMLGKPPVSTGQLRLWSGFEARRLTNAMGELQQRGWVVAAGQDRSRMGSMISLLWTTADDWWRNLIPRSTKRERAQAWQEFLDRLAAACTTGTSEAEHLLSWLPLADLARSGKACGFLK